MKPLSHDVATAYSVSYHFLIIRQRLNFGGRHLTAAEKIMYSCIGRAHGAHVMTRDVRYEQLAPQNTCTTLSRSSLSRCTVVTENRKYSTGTTIGYTYILYRCTVDLLQYTRCCPSSFLIFSFNSEPRTSYSHTSHVLRRTEPLIAFLVFDKTERARPSGFPSGGPEELGGIGAGR